MTFTKIITLTALTAALALAQGRPGRGPGNGGTPPDPATMIQHRVDMLTTQLSLTDAQKTQATKIFTDAFNSSQNARTALQTATQSLADAVKKNDTATIDQVATNMGNLEGQLAAIHAKAEAAFYAILTPDQQAKYHVGGGMRGPGAFGGRGGAMWRGRNQPPQ